MNDYFLNVSGLYSLNHGCDDDNNDDDDNNNNEENNHVNRNL